MCKSPRQEPPEETAASNNNHKPRRTPAHIQNVEQKNKSLEKQVFAYFPSFHFLLFCFVCLA